MSVRPALDESCSSSKSRQPASSPRPTSAALIGSFPNPFNASTTITYEVREAQEVTVSVWNLAGHQVAHLVSTTHSPGVYEVGFDAGDLPSGTYFVRLQTPQAHPISHKVILMK